MALLAAIIDRYCSSHLLHEGEAAYPLPAVLALAVCSLLAAVTHSCS